MTQPISTAPIAQQSILTPQARFSELCMLNKKIIALSKSNMILEEKLKGEKVALNKVKASIDDAPDSDIANLFAEKLRISQNVEQQEKKIILNEDEIAKLRIELTKGKEEEKNRLKTIITKKTLENNEMFEAERTYKGNLEVAKKFQDACRDNGKDPNEFIRLRNNVERIQKQYDSLIPVKELFQKSLNEHVALAEMYADAPDIEVWTGAVFDKTPKGIAIKVNFFGKNSDNGTLTFKVEPLEDISCRFELICVPERSMGSTPLFLRAIAGESLQDPMNLNFFYNSNKFSIRTRSNVNFNLYAILTPNKDPEEFGTL